MLIKKEQTDIYTIELTSDNCIPVKIDLYKDEIIAGSDDYADITLKSETLSKNIFKLVKKDSSYMLTKLSSDTVILNDNEINTDTELKSEDVIIINEFTLKYEMASKKDEKQAEFSAEEDESGKTCFMPVLSIDDIPDLGSLVCISGSLKGRVFPFGKDKISVGRDPSSDIPIEKDGLSRAHAIIEVGDKEITIIDFNSTNGTFVKGKKITTETVKPGTVIQFANSAFRYELAGYTDSDQPSPLKPKFIIYISVFILIIIASVTFFSLKQKKSIEQQKKKLEVLAEKIKEDGVSSPSKSLKIAQQAYESKNYEEAINIIEKILEKNPDYAGALLLKGKLQKAEKSAKLDANFNKAIQYYKANKFEKARKTFASIDAGYPGYQEVIKYMNILDKVDMVKEIFTQAVSDFNKGNIEKAVESIDYIIKKVPEYKPAKELKIQVEKINQIFASISDSQTTSDSEATQKHLKEILNIVPYPDNYYYQYARKKLKELKTGKNLKAEFYYCSGVEALAQRKYHQAYVNFKNAYNITPNVLKIKISLTESKQKRQKLILALYQAALKLNSQNHLKAKFIWKKIVAMGNKENSYYDIGLKKLQN